MADDENSAANEQERTESIQPSTKPSIVGIGASAGGVQALQTFFEALPDRTGVAFVVIVHLAPESHSELPRILAARTRMPVTQVNEPAPLEPDHVYVIPPDRHLRISEEEISAHEFDSPRGRRASIDLFFRSLAEQHGDDFAIILTGAGSDGAVGLKAVKEAGGIILVQDPNEAEYASMPRSAIATGLADFILPLREIAARVVELARNKEHALGQLRDADEEYVRRILAHVCSRTGHDFSQYKKSTVLRRIARRAQVTRREQLADYFAFLRDNVEEVQALFGDLLISVTTFFRDPKAFEALAKHVVPRLFEGKESSDSIRVWVPGCATGEEAYTIAILLLEEAARHDIRPQVQVFGSDLDAGGLAVAREGRYPVAIEADVSEERLRRFFAREGDHYRAKRELRDAVLFASHSLLRDPPFSRLDLISCRNLLIYLDRELQQQACGIFHYALTPNGFLFLGLSESAESPLGLFRTVDKEARIYQSAGRSGDKQLPLPILLGTPRRPQHAFHVPHAVTRPSAASETALHRLALEKEAPPSILVDETHRAVHLSENAGRFLQPSGGPLTSDVTELVRQELRSDLRAALRRAFERGESTLSLPIMVSFNGLPHRVYLQVKPVRQDAGAPARQALVLFIEGGPVEQMLAQSAELPDEKRETSDTVRRLREELQQTQAQLRATREDSEATNEELRATNEELQSINEEYRSTSEELETSKEELQSINEELQTVNNELKIKFEGISRAHSDLQNLMASTDVGTIFLDTALRIKLFTPYVADLFNIKPGDEGRPITDFTHQLDYDGLADDARAVLEKLAPVDREIRSLAQSWYLMRLRPYHTVDNKIDGVVITFVEVTELRNAEEDLRIEAALRESEARYRTAGEAIRYGVWVCNPEGGVEFVSQIFLDLIGKTLDEVKPRGWLDRLPPEDLKPTLDAWHECVRTGSEWTWEHRVKGKDGIYRTILSLGRPVRDDRDCITSWVGFNLDISERKQAENALRESENRMCALLDASQDEILLMSTQGEILAINKAAERRLSKRMGGSTPVNAHLDRLLPQDQVELRMAIVRQVAATTTLVHCDVPIRARWFEFWFYPVLQSDKPVSEVAVYAREITQQKKSQADLSKLSQAIQQSPMSVVITDRDGKIEYVNPEFTKVTGYTLAEVIGQNPHILKSGHTPPEQYVELWNTITSGGVWRGTFFNKKKNGDLFWELASIAPVKQGDKITNFVAVKEDITERRDMEEQLRQSQKMQAVGQLTGGIAHDFNNLLAIIMGNLQLLEMRVSGDAKAREYLDDALWSAKRGGELTHRLLAFARKQPLKPAVIDLNDVVNGMTELLRRTLGASIRIEESLAPNLWKAFADRGELERALINLAVNARDAMRSAGTLTLETRNAVLDEDYAAQYEEVTPGEYVLFAVADTGTGMSPEIMQRVFEPFFTTKEVGQGSGLGLSMVYGFTKQSGGHVSICSRVGQGTSVKLYLPRAPSSPVGREEGSPDVFPEDLENKVVLVVEDEAKLRKVAVKMLDRLGLQNMQAETAKDALELLAGTHVDVLFTDIELPGGMNGTELAEAAQKLDPNIKVLFTTGYARETTWHHRGLHERTPWLLKPYSHQELARELKALLVPTPH